MLITIGSTNQIKIHALEEALKDYPLFSNAIVCSVAVPSGVSEQPITLEEIITGAKNRAKKAYESRTCRYSFGLESGLLEAPGTQTGYLEACICCIYDGQNFHIGISSGFEVPPKILTYVFEDHLDLNEACLKAGVTQDPKIGSAEGLVGLLTKGRMPRKVYTKQSILTAMIQLEHAEFYRNSSPVQ